MYFFVYTTIWQHDTIIAVTIITAPKERCPQAYKPALRTGGDPYQYKPETPEYFSFFIQSHPWFPRPAVQHPRPGRYCNQPDHDLSQSRDRFLGKCTNQFCAGCSLRRTFSLFLLQWKISAQLPDHHCRDLSDRFSGDVFYQRRLSWRHAGMPDPPCDSHCPLCRYFADRKIHSCMRCWQLLYIRYRFSSRKRHIIFT